MEPIFHLALRDEWDAALASGGPYDRSTIGASLSDVGFIHCSFASQVAATAGRYYAGREDVLVLTIDPDAVRSDLRIELAPGTGELFPHFYGPIPLEAVVKVRPLESGA
jgi:glutathione S-transferase